MMGRTGSMHLARAAQIPLAAANVTRCTPFSFVVSSYEYASGPVWAHHALMNNVTIDVIMGIRTGASLDLGVSHCLPSR